MAASPNEQMPELATERVRGGRRAALLVVGLALVVVGALVWKPWDTHSPAPGLPSQLPAAFVPTSSPPLPTSPPPTNPEDSPGFTTFGPDPVSAPNGLGSIFLPADSAFVHCIYGPAKGGNRPLKSLVVGAPTIIPGPSSDPRVVGTVDYRPEIEANSLESVFSAEWRFLSAGDAQSSPLDQDATNFSPVQLKAITKNLSGSAVLRVAVVVTWTGADGTELANVRVYPSTYAVIGSRDSRPVSDGCPAFSTAAE